MAKSTKITIHPAFKIGEISPRLYSTFLEPIGTMVNGTMFNPKHPTADENGFRRDFIDGLKDLGMPACRFARRKLRLLLGLEGLDWSQVGAQGSP